MAPKELVRRWVEEVINRGEFGALDELCTRGAAERSRAWIEPFREAFPDVEMKVIELVAEEDRVAGRFACSATHLGKWGGRAPTGRRFEDVDEVYFFGLEDGQISDWWALEDNLSRRRQLGLDRGHHPKGANDGAD
jgi:predicted ester cyclase